MGKIKYLIYSLVFLGGLFFLLSPEVLPNNTQLKEVFNSTPQNDIIVIFNSGGWGDTPLREAQDFAPIIQGIQDTVSQWGYSSIVVPYERTEGSLLGKISGAKETFQLFRKQAEDFSRDIDDFLNKNPGKKIIIAGLCNGGIFTNRVMESVPNRIKNRVYAIEVGVPFWEETSNSDNIIIVNDKEEDPLFRGEAKILFSTLFKGMSKWFLAKISGESVSLAQFFYMPGHQYSWGEVQPEVVSFLERKLR